MNAQSFFPHQLIIQRASKTTFPRLEIAQVRKIPTQDNFGPPWDVRTDIRVPLPSPLFRDLFLTLEYRLKTARGPVSNLHVELSEIGWGVPGLIPADTQIHTSVTNLTIYFEIHITVELKIGAMEKDGISLPLPFPKHRGTVSGWFNTQNHDHYAVFHDFGSK